MPIIHTNQHLTTIKEALEEQTSMGDPITPYPSRRDLYPELLDVLLSQLLEIADKEYGGKLPPFLNKEASRSRFNALIADQGLTPFIISEANYEDLLEFLEELYESLYYCPDFIMEESLEEIEALEAPVLWPEVHKILSKSKDRASRYHIYPKNFAEWPKHLVVDLLHGLFEGSELESPERESPWNVWENPIPIWEGQTDICQELYVLHGWSLERILNASREELLQAYNDRISLPKAVDLNSSAGAIEIDGRPQGITATPSESNPSNPPEDSSTTEDGKEGPPTLPMFLNLCRFMLSVSAAQDIKESGSAKTVQQRLKDKT